MVCQGGGDASDGTFAYNQIHKHEFLEIISIMARTITHPKKYQIGEEEMRRCKALNLDVLMIRVGELDKLQGDGLNGQRGWRCLHDGGIHRLSGRK